MGRRRALNSAFQRKREKRGKETVAIEMSHLLLLRHSSHISSSYLKGAKKKRKKARSHLKQKSSVRLFFVKKISFSFFLLLNALRVPK